MPFNLSLTSKEITSGGSSYLRMKDLKNGQPYRISLVGDDNAQGFFLWGRPKDPSGTSRPECFRWTEEPDAKEIEDLKEDHPDLEFLDFNGKSARPKIFCSFFIWDYELEQISCWEITQKSIRADLERQLTDPEVANDPTRWDFTITKEQDSGGFTTYSLDLKPGRRIKEGIASQVNEAWEAVVDAGADLSRIFVGGDPFTPSKSKVPF